jgi:transketolase
MLLYSLLHLFNYGLTIEDLKNFRQADSLTPGHPEYGHTRGVEMTTGPLGQGIATAVGMALAEEYLAAKFNKPGYNVVDHHTFAITGDGCLMEGISSEAASLAGHLKLGKLVVLYDSNSISIEGSTEIAFTEDVCKRFEAFGWQTLEVADGNDTKAIGEALVAAKTEKSKPTLIKVTTQIGYGCPAKQGKSSAHGEPLGADNLLAAKEFLGWEADEFYVPDEVRAFMDEKCSTLANEQAAWNKLFEAYANEYPELAKEWNVWFNKKLPIDLLNDEDFWTFADDYNVASRASGGDVLNRLAKIVPNMIGGSADLSPSTKTIMSNTGDFTPTNRTGANLHFGVREHAMAAMTNGITLHGGLRAYAATFFVFSDYMKHSMRLSALMNLPATYVLTHDSIGVGEDGPTHEPIEHLAMLRSIPNFNVYRPADAREVAAAWYFAVEGKNGPTALVLSRQNLPMLPNTGKNALKGGYTIVECEKEIPDVILMATGSEVYLIVEAAEKLKQEGIDVRVVSMPCFEQFDAQSDEYKESVLPNAVRARVAVEAAGPMGWYKYVGLDGAIIAMESYGASAPGDLLFERFGFTVENVIEKTKNVLSK